MLKIILALVAGAGVAAGGYMVVTHHCPSEFFSHSSSDDSCCSPDNSKLVFTEAPATESAPLIDVKNTKCVVMGEDISTRTVDYQGKTYHICCPECIDTFKKDPEKYIKALEAEPAKFGIQKQ